MKRNWSINSSLYFSHSRQILRLSGQNQVSHRSRTEVKRTLSCQIQGNSCSLQVIVTTNPPKTRLNGDLGRDLADRKVRPLDFSPGTLFLQSKSTRVIARIWNSERSACQVQKLGWRPFANTAGGTTQSIDNKPRWTSHSFSAKPFYSYSQLHIKSSSEAMATFQKRILRPCFRRVLFTMTNNGGYNRLGRTWEGCMYSCWVGGSKKFDATSRSNVCLLYYMGNKF